ncbi:MAG: PEP-CTERM sorting domain-containing protein, partial [Sedimentisphaerales bacterium]
ASFTGNALVIIGKGYESDASYALNPDWDNTLSGSVNFGWNIVDYVRIEVIPEPATICLLLGGAFGLLRRKA